MSDIGRVMVLASSNPGKLAEMRAILAGTGLEIRPQSEYDIAPAEETGLSFVENAIIKARHASRITGLPALADDSGLCVDALNGEPGVHSARYADQGVDQGAGQDVNRNASDAANTTKLLAAMEKVAGPLRSARFQCVIAVLRHAADPVPIICQGTWEGSIQTGPAGSNGFGYDPVFHVPDHACSAAELDSDTKNRISHRGQALAALKQQLSLLGVRGT